MSTTTDTIDLTNDGSEKINEVDNIHEDTPVEESAIDEKTQQNYRVWKKNAPLLYDYLVTNSLLWPSLSVQFFPDITHMNDLGENKNEEQIIAQRIQLGTFTLGQAIDHISILQIPSFKNLNQNIKINKLDFNPEREEFELTTPSLNKTKTLQKINHLGDVNKVRYMPQKPNILASANNLGNLVIYERTRHKSFKNTILDDTDLSKVQVRLVNKHIPSTTDIFAIDWNRNSEGLLLSADMNGLVNLYDLKKYESETLNESQYWENNAIGVNDIEWFPTHDSLFCTTDDNGWLKLYDTRSQSAAVQNANIGNSVNSVACNPGYATGLATGDSNGVIKMWDIRTFDNSLSELHGHSDSVTQLKWNPKCHNILGSSSSDHLVKLHDMSNDSTIFTHLGHMLGVNDFDWSYADPWMVASVADDNSLHVWKPTHSVTDKFK